MMIVLVTVLLENNKWSNATPSTIRKGRKRGDTSPIRPMRTSASHSAAPVWYTMGILLIVAGLSLGMNVEAGNRVEVAAREELGCQELSQEREGGRVQRDDAQVTEGEKPAAHISVVAAGRVVRVCELRAGDGEALHERSVAFGDEQHEERADEKTDGRSQWSRTLEEIAGEHEASETDDAAESERCHVTRPQ